MPWRRPGVSFASVRPAGGDRPEPVHQGNLLSVALSDLVRSLCGSEGSFRVEVWEEETLLGEIWIAGTITACQAAGRRAEDAFFRLAEALGGQFRVFREGQPGDAGGLPTPLEDMLEIADWVRERARLKPQPLAALREAVGSAVPERPRLALVPSEDPQPPFETLFQAAMTAYFKRDYPQARGLFERCRELQPGDVRVLHNLESIRQHEAGR